MFQKIYDTGKSVENFKAENILTDDTMLSYSLKTMPFGDCFLGDEPDRTTLSMFLRMNQRFGVTDEVAVSKRALLKCDIFLHVLN